MAHRPEFSRAEPRPSIEPLELRRLLSAGQLDSTFGTDGIAYGPLFPGMFENSLTATAIQRDGEIVALGAYFPTGARPGEFALARYKRDGSVDRTFGSGGRVITAFPSAFDASALAVAVQADGKIVVAGDLTFDNIVQTPAGTVENFTGALTLTRYLPDGHLDGTFGKGRDCTVRVVRAD